VPHDPEQDKSAESSKNDDLLQDYFNEMLGFGEASSSSNSSTQVEAQSRHNDFEAKESLTTRESGLKPKALENEHVRDVVSPPEVPDKGEEKPKTSRVHAKPATIRPYSPEPAKQAVIPSLMPKLKTASALETKVEEKAAEPKVKVEEAKPVVEEKVKEFVDRKSKLRTETEVMVAAETAFLEQAQKEVSEQTELKVSANSDEGVPPQTPSAPSFRDMNAFEVLLFEVRGLQLAVPLVSLGSIHKIDTEFTPIVGRADWFLGLFRSNERNLQVVDTARWVMPGRAFDADQSDYAFVIRLGDSDWGLACNSVNQSVRISREEIKWRTKSSRRPWLAGTVINKMCALLDVENMAALLDEDKLHSS
jgi:purine-binding chemotaxis protein CheW